MSDSDDTAIDDAEFSEHPTPEIPPSHPDCEECAWVVSSKRTSGYALTPERKAIYLDTLAKTGSHTAAAAAATPYSRAPGAGKSTFLDEQKRNPQFALDCVRAEEQALATVESALMKRALEPTSRPIYSRGEHVGEELKYDNQLLLRVAGRLNPAWREKQQVEHSGTVEHNARGAFLSIHAADVLLLPREDQESLVMLVKKLRELRKALPEGKPDE